MRRIWGALALALAWGGSPAAAAPERTVVVVMFDGFSPAELDAARPTPNFDRLKREGAWSRHLVPVFPTLSMANHAAFETGCWPAHDGILSNAFYDPARGLYNDRFANVADADWRTGCESLWEAAERQGVRSAAFNWVGRWSTRRGRLASFVNPNVAWKDHESDQSILAKAIALLHDEKPDRPRLIALYFDIPDHVAHYDGVAGERTVAAVRRCDEIVGKLMAAIESMPAGREGTLVIGSDHGMMDVGPIVNIGRLMNMYDIRAKQASDGATTIFYLDKGESAERVMKALSGYSYAFAVYKRGHYPPYAHLGEGPRAGDLLLVAKPPYWVVGPDQLPLWAKLLGVTQFWPATFTPFAGGLKADHGYPPSVVQMHAIFYAWGAGVRPREIQRLDMIDIHPTVMALLGLKPGRPVDGKKIELGTVQPSP
ncbi:MAG TPA: ectonucleotide pyrophosphatase/phosphodiesterase [Rhizomicrobium sp.]|jgi:alkaline phosphatase D|nr:ectonucleotide pyrophosphatase/phosphodiesterase [Rhizomicrobium sp.]